MQKAQAKRLFDQPDRRVTGDAENRLERHVTGLLYFGLYEEMAEYDA